MPLSVQSFSCWAMHHQILFPPAPVRMGRYASLLYCPSYMTSDITFVSPVPFSVIFPPRSSNSSSTSLHTASCVYKCTNDRCVLSGGPPRRAESPRGTHPLGIENRTCGALQGVVSRCLEAALLLACYGGDRGTCVYVSMWMRLSWHSGFKVWGLCPPFLVFRNYNRGNWVFRILSLLFVETFSKRCQNIIISRSCAPVTWNWVQPKLSNAIPVAMLWSGSLFRSGSWISSTRGRDG